MKQFENLTQKEAEQIALFEDRKVVRFRCYSSSNKRSWHSPVIIIATKCTTKGDRQDEEIYIYETGKVTLRYRDGNWGGSGLSEINGLPIIDYLRKQGYEFNY